MQESTVISFDIGIKNLAYCILKRDLGSAHHVISAWDVIDVSRGDTIKTHDIYAVSSSLFDALNETFSYIDEGTTVLIENQPCMKNPVMKSLQMMIFSYFVLRGKDMAANTSVKLISAANKLKVKHKDKISDAVKEETNKYKKNKKSSVEITAYYLRNVLNVTEEFHNVFATSKKKDDLADSFLQAIHFLEITNAL
jgi:hypothetical protein